MKKLVRTVPVLLALTVGVAGCGGDNPFGVVTDTGGDFAITVSGDIAPDYSWQDTNASRLTVVRTSDGLQFWRIDATAGAGGFASPVSHGIVPAGATESVESQILASGVEYRVEITLLDGRTGRETFVP